MKVGIVLKARAAADTVQPYAEAGATWWIEQFWVDITLERLTTRALAGPPRVS